MTNSKIHGILSAIHGLLNSYTDSELLEAARYPGLSRAIGAALRALASESNRSASRLGGTPTGPLARGHYAIPRPVPKTAEVEILGALRSSPYFASTNAIAEFAKSLGIRIQRAPKESKERVAKRLVRAVVLLPEGRRSQIMRELSNNRSGQTQGWIDVIKTSRNE